MSRTLVRQRDARALSGAEMRVVVDAGTRWAWQLEDALAAIYEAQILAVYDQAARLLARIARPITAAAPPAGWTIPDPDELGLSLRSQMDERHRRRQAGDDASDAIRVDAVHRVTEAGLQAMGVSLSLRNPLVEGVLRDQLGGNIGIRETTRRAIMTSLEASWQAGDSIPRAARALRAEAPEVAQSRARTIARTELLAAVNGGAHALASISNEAALANGEPPLLKIWLCADDEKVRDTHGFDGGAAEKYRAGRGIAMSEPFRVGESELQYPGDPAGAAAEVINCRCAISYEERDEPAPPSTPDAVAEAVEETPVEPRVPDFFAPPPSEGTPMLTGQALRDALEAERASRTPGEVEAEVARRVEEQAVTEKETLDDLFRIAKEHGSRDVSRSFVAPAGNLVRVGRAADEWDSDRLTRMFSSDALERNELVTRVESYVLDSERISVNAFINTEEGSEVAEVERTINLAQHSASHDSFFITDDEYKGVGIAKDILRSSVAEYDETGITRVNVHAAGANGRYTWARFGFDFKEPGDAAWYRDDFKRRLVNAISDATEKRRLLPDELAAQFPETLARIDAAEHTWEFAGLSVDENGLDVPDFGKQAMLDGPGFYGVLDLTPGSESRKVFDDYTR